VGSRTLREPGAAPRVVGADEPPAWTKTRRPGAASRPARRSSCQPGTGARARGMAGGWLRLHRRAHAGDRPTLSTPDRRARPLGRRPGRPCDRGESARGQSAGARVRGAPAALDRRPDGTRVQPSWCARWVLPRPAGTPQCGAQLFRLDVPARPCFERLAGPTAFRVSRRGGCWSPGPAVCCLPRLLEGAVAPARLALNSRVRPVHDVPRNAVGAGRRSGAANPPGREARARRARSRDRRPGPVRAAGPRA